jgi:DNA modification methylase
MNIRADARHIPLVDGCVQTCVTSPPYWGLRDYGTSGQIGLESTPEAYVASIVSVFREVRRVLKDDGTAWLNIGDSYAREGGKTAGVPRHWDGREHDPGGMHAKRSIASEFGAKPKDLVGIPWRVAFALQADGWYLRSDIIWAKNNPMPESVTDRPTKSHEYLFLLTKSATYYYDADAIRENYTSDQRGDLPPRPLKALGPNDRGGHSQWETGLKDSRLHDGRNKRSVWTIPTMPYSGAHFATMPEALVEPCILAGSRLGDLVFDPFLGSGTVGAVAERLGRRWAGTDLNYQPLSKARTAQRGLRFEPIEATA